MKTRPQIEASLVEEVQRAKEAYDLAKREFQEAAADIPSGLPAPDGTGRIMIAGHKAQSSMEAYGRALRELNDFLLRGVVPGRLRDTPPPNLQ